MMCSGWIGQFRLAGNRSIFPMTVIHDRPGRSMHFPPGTAHTAVAYGRQCHAAANTACPWPMVCLRLAEDTASGSHLWRGLLLYGGRHPGYGGLKTGHVAREAKAGGLFSWSQR